MQEGGRLPSPCFMITLHVLHTENIKSEALCTTSQRKKPHQKEPLLCLRVLCLSVIAGEWEKGSMLYQYVP